MSWKNYPVTKTELNHDGYEVKVNGENVSLDAARVSSYPFNRRWPGHQRSIDQTHLVNFLSLEADEPLKFEIKPKEKFEKVNIRPISLGIEPEITDDGRIIFTLEKPAYFTVEPYGIANALHIFVDPVIDYSHIDKNDENVIYFGKGEHDVGMINLKSNQTVFIDEGAVLYACIHAMDADNIKIVGRGILDNSRNKEKILYEENVENNDAAVNNAERIHTVQIEYCNNVTIEGITMRDSLVYNVRPLGCDNLDIRNVKLIGNWRYNSDGIDMHNCTNVCLDNCFIRTFDDSICIKGFDHYYEEDPEKATFEATYHNGKVYDVFKNATIKNCVIWNDWGKCLEIGAETRGKEICDITFEDCHIIHAIGSPLDCQSVDYADVHDITYKNMTIEYDEVFPRPAVQLNDKHEYVNTEPDYEPEIIRVDIFYSPEMSAKGGIHGICHDMTFENVRLYSRKRPKLVFSSLSQEYNVYDINVRNIYHNDELMRAEDLEVETDEFCKNINIE